MRVGRPRFQGVTPYRIFGKPRRVICPFRHQDAQPPPSPTRGEGGRGDEGQKRAGMQNITYLSQEIYYSVKRDTGIW